MGVVAERTTQEERNQTMSKRSQFKINQRAREGVQGQRRAEMHVLRVLTAQLALRVATNLREQVIEEVGHELDRRGYAQEAQASDQGSLSNRKLTASILEGVRESTYSTPTETPEGEGCSSETVREDEVCPSCYKENTIKDPNFSDKILCPNCQSNWDRDET